MYPVLSKYLAGTRISFVEACKAFNLDPAITDPESLAVTQCDVCDYWDKFTSMIIEENGTVLCRTCDISLDAKIK